MRTIEAAKNACWKKHLFREYSNRKRKRKEYSREQNFNKCFSILLPWNNYIRSEAMDTILSGMHSNDGMGKRSIDH